MPQIEGTAMLAHTQAEPAATSQQRPVLFLHIPKTAGTSFLLTLQNAFGDNRVQRILTVDERVQESIDNIVKDGLDQISCLAGHLPIHLFKRCLDWFQPFTVLRDPVSRVVSLFRFIKASNPNNLVRLGLRQDFSLHDFLGSRHPELYGQVNNGMVRMLCGDARLDDPDVPEFWNSDSGVASLARALANLERIDFGITEDMHLTLKLAQVRWSVPYRLRQYHENATTPNEADENAVDVLEIIARNTLDLALYHKARTIFRERVRSLPQPPSEQSWNRLSVFIPHTDCVVAVGDIAGRQGFYEFEPIGLAWLRAGQTADIQFAARTGLVRLKLQVFCVVPEYPVADIVVSINNKRVQHKFLFADDRWGCLETDYFETLNGLNLLEVETPLFVQAAALDPQSGDKRRLGVALANVTFQS